MQLITEMNSVVIGENSGKFGKLRIVAIHFARLSICSNTTLLSAELLTVTLFDLSHASGGILSHLFSSMLSISGFVLYFQAQRVSRHGHKCLKAQFMVRRPLIWTVMVLHGAKSAWPGTTPRVLRKCLPSTYSLLSSNTYSIMFTWHRLQAPFMLKSLLYSRKFD